MSSWFGSLDLATKYIVVFGALLFITVIAGLIKLFFIRRQHKKHAKADIEKQRAKADAPANTIYNTELTTPKEEGDLFGVRAIESGFFGGVAQSRPASPASSRAPSISGRPVSPAGSMSGSNNRGSGMVSSVNGPQSPSLLSPRSNKAPPGPIRLPSNNSTASLPLRSPLSQNPFTAEELKMRNGPPVDSPTLPMSGRLHENHPSPSYGPGPNGYQRANSTSPVSFNHQAPQLDLPQRGFSPLDSAEAAQAQVDSRNRSFSRPLSFKSHRASKTQFSTEEMPRSDGGSSRQST